MIPKMPQHSKFGRKLLASMNQVADALESKHKRHLLTIRRVEPFVPDPTDYSAARVRATRQRLNLSQAAFARLLGISTVLAQSWEQGKRKPSKLACRLLDEINARPEHWRRRLRAA